MTHSSIGSGTGTDGNENHPTDGLPSKTMGAETQVLPASSQTTPVLQDSAAPAPAPDASENELASPPKVLEGLPLGPVGANLGNFPDRPNVAPSPWEKDAAQGKG